MTAMMMYTLSAILLKIRPIGNPLLILKQLRGLPVLRLGQMRVLPVLILKQLRVLPVLRLAQMRVLPVQMRAQLLRVVCLSIYLGLFTSYTIFTGLRGRPSVRVYVFDINGEFIRSHSSREYFSSFVLYSPHVIVAQWENVRKMLPIPTPGKHTMCFGGLTFPFGLTVVMKIFT